MNEGNVREENSDDDNEGNDSEENSDDDSLGQDNFNANQLFYCDLCEFNTKHSSGLKIHVGKCHKNKCENCGKTFSGKDFLDRHNIAEMIVNHADPLESPDNAKKLVINEDGEPYLEVISNDCNKNNPIALIYFENDHFLHYWQRRTRTNFFEMRKDYKLSIL